MVKNAAARASIGDSRGRAASELRTAGLLALVAVLFVGLAPYVLGYYSVNVLIRSFLYAAAALTVDLLWGYAGVLTFGQAAFFAIGAYACGLTFTHLGFSPVNAVLALVGGALAAAAVAALVGWLAFVRGMSVFYFAVVTLALAVVVTQVLYSGGAFTGSSSGLSGFQTFSLSVEAWFWITGGALILLTAGAWIFVRSDAGRILVAIRENEQRCDYLGIRTARVKLLLLVVMAVIASFAGYGYAAYTDVIAPELAGFVFATELVVWVALGGRGTLIGPVLAAILIDFTSAYLSGNLPFVWKLVVGLAFVGVIIALPQGLMPVIAGGWRRLARRRLRLAEARSGWMPSLEESTDTKTAATASLTGDVSAAIELRQLSRRYGSLRVLEGIDFKAHAGEVLSLVGPNGAGKTTLIRCISDGMERTGGSVLINGHDVGRLSPYRLVGFGLGRKFQTPNVFEALTVAECLRIARCRLERPSLVRRVDTLRLPLAALQVLKSTALDTALGIEVKHLPHGTKQALEVAMVLALEPSVLLLDEPTAGLTRQERSLIGDILVDLARNHNLCVLLVEHDLDFVRVISSRVIVLHQGQIALDGTVQEVVESELVRTIYSGEEHAVGKDPLPP